jgi:gliding motility-associated-like protein
MYNMQTTIYTDTVYFCAGFDNLPLTWESVGRTPWGGQWTGNGVINPEGNYFEFSPVIAGIGEHWLTYSNNNCTDSLMAIVYPNQLSVESIELCSDSEAFAVQEDLPSGGYWWGNGITDNWNGVFDPENASGEYYIYWTTWAGCYDSVYVFVEEFLQADISGLDDVYCYQDFEIDIGLYPDGGSLTGSTTDSTFNPAQANQGINTLIYQYSGSYCYSADTIEIWVYPQIETSLFADNNPICNGAGTNLWVEAEGGFPDSLLTFTWSHDLFPISTNTVSPGETTTYYVEIDDGCSDPSLDSIIIEILSPISALVTTSDTSCFGEDGWAEALAYPSGDYSYSWGSNPEIPGNSVEGIAGSSWVLEITDNEFGCVFDTLVLIPNYTPIAANFSVNPNASCIPFDENPLNFIDLSQYALEGTWDFGNGQTSNYDPGNNPYVNYDQAGDYQVTLIVLNEGDCRDTMILDICILPATPIFIPDIFSPNGDGWNDFLYVRGEGITSMQFAVFDRWGEEVFYSDTPEKGWDGNYRAKQMPSGVYVYYLRALLNNGEVEELKGDVTLLR